MYVSQSYSGNPWFNVVGGGGGGGAGEGGATGEGVGARRRLGVSPVPEMRTTSSIRKLLVAHSSSNITSNKQQKQRELKTENEQTFSQPSW